MTAAHFHPVRPVSLLGLAGPLLAIAVLAFLAGFGGYLILGPANVLGLNDPAPQPASVSSNASAASDLDTPDWNQPKRI